MAVPRRRATGWQQLRGAAVITAVLTAMAPLIARPAFAAATVPPNSVSLVSDPGIALVAPADGRLRGDHLAATVTGVAWAGHVGLGASARQAARGQLLVVFGLQGAHLGQTGDGVGSAIPPVTGTLIVDGQRSALAAPENDDGSAPVCYLASVPSSAREVDLELAAAGLAQRFSLAAGARVGPQPVVLYRDRLAWQPMDQVNPEQDLATPDSTDGLPGATLPIRVHDVYLAWFGPDGPADVPPSPDRTWLVVDATSEDDSQISHGLTYLHYLSGLSAAQVTLSLPGGQTVTSQLLNPGSGETGVGVFDGIYDFAVPADLTAATLKITPSNFQVTVAFSGSAPVTVAAHGQATFPIAFPAPYQPPPPVAPARPASQRAAPPSPATGSGGGGGLNPAIPIAAVVVVLLAAMAVALARRHRRGVQRAAAGPSATLPADMAPTVVPSDRSTPNGSRKPSLTPSDLAPRQAAEPLSATPAAPPPPGPAPPSVLTVLAPVPAGPPEPPPGILYFEVLGPFRVTGWPADPPRSSPVIDLATYLAFHTDRPYTAEELRDPLSFGKPRALEADTIRTYANKLRRTVGAEHLPEAGRRGYALSGFDTDWQRFLELTAAAEARTEPADQALSLTEAMALVRGLPFTELPANGFGWVANELLISQVEVAVIAGAGRLADLALAAGDWPLAAWAAERGVLVSPAAWELNARALRASARSGQPDRLAQAWRDVTRRYTASDEDVPSELVQLREQLRRPV